MKKGRVTVKAELSDGRPFVRDHIRQRLPRVPESPSPSVPGFGRRMTAKAARMVPSRQEGAGSYFPDSGH